jgi:cytochrome c oxidase accessory protein FixG
MSKPKNTIVEIPVTSLYAASEKVYQREVKGLFQTIRNACVILLLGLYYGAPWVQWGERQAVLFDLPARKFHIFGLTLWPQDFFFLALLLILAGLSLFFFTAVAGRVWCGFACPQTVWTEAFLKMERWVEGSRSQQIKLTAAPWTFSKIRKRVTKQFLWISFSLITGLTFVGYFEPIRELVVDFVNLEVAGWSLFWVLFYGFATYGNAGFMREQVCKYMCPYARFQSAMFDKDTLIVAYNEKRGEPRSRGKKRKDDLNDNTGDCIDCGLCVQVCPTGIDIRDGLQYECIACAACVDACDEVMTKIDLPKGLIRYSSENHDNGISRNGLLQSVLRPRVLIYGALLSMVFIGFVTALALRSNFQVDILRDRNALFRYASDSQIENTYQVKVMNKSQEAQKDTVTIQGLDQAEIRWSKETEAGISRTVEAGHIGDFTVSATLPVSANYRRSQTVNLVFREVNGQHLETITEETRFWAPAK